MGEYTEDTDYEDMFSDSNFIKHGLSHKPIMTTLQSHVMPASTSKMQNYVSGEQFNSTLIDNQSAIELARKPSTVEYKSLINLPKRA